MHFENVARFFVENSKNCSFHQPYSNFQIAEFAGNADSTPYRLVCLLFNTYSILNNT